MLMPTPQPLLRWIGLVAPVLTLSLLALSPLSAQDQQDGEAKSWFKGNLHTHSLWSDGNDFPEMICEWYAQRDYHFLTLSDHNILSRGENWISDQLPIKRGANQALPRYQARFGDAWVETREVEGKGSEIRLKTLEEFRGKFERPGEFLLIQSEEITDHFGSLPVHINATNLAELIRPQGGESVVATIENNLKAVEAQRLKLGRPMIAHLNHPNFGYGVSVTDLAAATREHFFEVFNGHPSVNQLGDDTHVGIERMWDIANALRLVHFKARPLYGVATDDSHHYFSEQGSIPGRGWVQVHATSLDPDRLIEAMEAGDFYASTGVTLKSVQWQAEAKRLTVQIQAEEGVGYTTFFMGTRRDVGDELVKAYQADPNLTDFPEQVGEVLAQVEGATAVYEMTGDELYVRAVVRATQAVERPVWPDQPQQAWTQPVGWLP